MSIDIRRQLLQSRAEWPSSCRFALHHSTTSSIHSLCGRPLLFLPSVFPNSNVRTHVVQSCNMLLNTQVFKTISFVCRLIPLLFRILPIAVNNDIALLLLGCVAPTSFMISDQLNLDQELNQVHVVLHCTNLNSVQLMPFS